MKNVNGSRGVENEEKMRIILALSVMLLFLTACGQEDDEKITLNMAWWGSQVRHDATVKVIELYEEKILM